MADRWMDDRDRRMRDRDWRRSEDMNRGGSSRFSGSEDRSFDDGSQGYGQGSGSSYGSRWGQGGERDRVFGERETGASYGGQDMRSGGGSNWQDRDYGGVSPAMEKGEYDLERRAERYQREHPVDRNRGGQGSYQGGAMGGGRFYGDSGRERVYRQEYGQGGVEYGDVPRGYDAGRGDAGRDGRTFSGGTGGYDYERGYGDGGRQSYGQSYGQSRGGYGRDEDRGERFEQRGREMGRETGDFFRRAGEKVASWFGGGETERGYGDSDRDRGFRGMGPKGYKRGDERISDEVHERLTDDPWVDASNISVSVSGGEVTLSGTVENRESKHRAERCVEDISGVTHVQNNLRIDRGSSLTSAPRGFGDSVLEHQMRGETGSGDSVSGNALGGTGSTNNTASKGTNGSAGSTSTSTDTGKSR